MAGTRMMVMTVHAAQFDRLVIDVHYLSTFFNTPYTGILSKALDKVSFGIQQLYQALIQVRLFGRPYHGMLQNTCHIQGYRITCLYGFGGIGQDLIYRLSIGIISFERNSYRHLI